jgi:ribosomal protein S18 acetylase RimI-like enzyme
MTGKVTVRDLGQIAMERIHQASTEAFRDYPVDVQMTIQELESMFRQNSVFLELSAGLFDGDDLVGFWINGLRVIDGRKVAYDSGTAIIKEYRGRGLSKQLAVLSNRLLIEHGAQEYVLEVLTQNETAYGIYLKNGFSVRRRLLCLHTHSPVYTNNALPAELTLEKCPFDPDVVPQLPAMEYEPSWQNATESMANVKDEVLAALVAARRSDRRLWAVHDPAWAHLTNRRRGGALGQHGSVGDPPTPLPRLAERGNRRDQHRSRGDSYPGVVLPPRLRARSRSIRNDEAAGLKVTRLRLWSLHRERAGSRSRPRSKSPGARSD